MNKFKRIMSITLVGCVAASALMMSAGAVTRDMSSEIDITSDCCGVNEMVENEADIYLKLQSMTDRELRESGYTEKEIAQLREFDLGKAIIERASLDDFTLRDMGYTQEDIDILRQYHGELITENSAVYATLAQLTGVIVCKGASTSQISFEYQWAWDKVPVTNQTDNVALRWVAYNPQGQEISVSLTSSNHIVNYQGGNTVPKSISVARNGLMQGVSSQFERAYRNPEGDYLYAMTGRFRIVVRKDGSDPMGFIKISRAYGHVVFSKPTNPTINVSFSGKFDISFSAALATTQIDTLDNDRIIRINSNGSVVDA